MGTHSYQLGVLKVRGDHGLDFQSDPARERPKPVSDPARSDHARSDPARQVHVLGQDRCILWSRRCVLGSRRCCFKGQEGAFWDQERSFGWMTRFRRLARDFERLGSQFGGLHFVAFGILMLAKYFKSI